MKLIGASQISWLSLRCVSWPSVDALSGQVEMREVAKCGAFLQLGHLYIPNDIIMTF